MSKWKTINHKTSVDVVPINDDREHGYGDECWCEPVIEQTAGTPIVTHNETAHDWGEWLDAEPILIGGKTKILSIRHCHSCDKKQSRIGHVTKDKS